MYEMVHAGTIQLNCDRSIGWTLTDMNVDQCRVLFTAAIRMCYPKLSVFEKDDGFMQTAFAGRIFQKLLAVTAIMNFFSSILFSAI